MKSFFVTGTDTGVGKTVASAALLYRLRAEGLRAVGMKPVAAGLVQQGGEWVAEDALALRAASTVAVPGEDMPLTLYTVYGDVFAGGCATLAVLCLVINLGRRLRCRGITA